MLRRLKIQRYRNVAPGTELIFHEGIHVLLGPNGGGKTTLLTLISSVIRGDFTEMQGEEFSLEYALGLNLADLDVRVSHALVTGEKGDKRWRDEVHATVKTPYDTARVDAVDGVVERDAPGNPRRPDLSLFTRELNSDLSAFGAPVAQTMAIVDAKRLRNAHRFDEALSFFESIRGAASLANRRITLTVAKHADATPQFAGDSHELLTSLLIPAMAPLRALSDPEFLTVGLERLGVLEELPSLLSMASGTFRAILGPQGRTVSTYDRFEFRFKRRDGTTVRDEHLSFGQKRLVAFVFYLWANEGPVVADELVDGMHYRWVERCFELMRGRQCFLSSQNPLLMDFVSLASAEDVARTFVLCDTVVDAEGYDALRWRGLTSDEASGFFDAYQVGIQHVSEILRDKGLW